MQAFSNFNNGIKYLLTVIDVFSRYGWMVPLKTKTGLEVANALKNIFQQKKIKETLDRSWKGVLQQARPRTDTSIFRRKRRKIKHCGKVESHDEREVVFSANSARKYIDILDRLVEDYNNTTHSSTGYTLNEASQKKNKSEVW